MLQEKENETGASESFGTYKSHFKLIQTYLFFGSLSKAFERENATLRILICSERECNNR